MENTKSEIKNYRLYTTKSDLLSKIIEEYFDCFCGIHGQYLRRVNQAKFAGLFEKHKPAELSFE